MMVRRQKILILAIEGLFPHQEIQKFNPQLADHAVICTHADNSPVEEIPLFSGKISKEQRQTLRELKSKNRRITIEDRTVNQIDNDE